MKVCAKPAIELELKLYQTFNWSSKSKEMQNAHGPLLFYKENVKTFPLLSQLAKAIFCMLPASLHRRDFLEEVVVLLQPTETLLIPKTKSFLHLLKIIELCKKKIIMIKFSCFKLFFFKF
jgi:hypothetical protein